MGITNKNFKIYSNETLTFDHFYTHFPNHMFFGTLKSSCTSLQKICNDLTILNVIKYISRSHHFRCLYLKFMYHMAPACSFIPQNILLMITPALVQKLKSLSMTSQSDVR